MAKKLKLLVFVLLIVSFPWTLYAASAPPAKPALVLAAFGTTTKAFSTYDKIGQQVKERFPGYEVRWAFTSKIVRRIVREKQHKNLPSLPDVLRELKKAGYTRIAVQSFLLAPGEEWENIVKQSLEIPGIKVAVGQPLLSSKSDEVKVLKVLSKEFPADLQKNAVVLVGHGSPDPRAQAAYNSFAQLLHSRYPGGNVFFGMVEFEKPGRAEVVREVKKSGATSVKIIPFLLVAGDHVQNDILGSGPKSWKSELANTGKSVQGVRRGLGDQKAIVDIYLSHLTQALQKLQSK